MKIWKISFNRILSSFNYVIQVDYLFVTELTKDPILLVSDIHSGYSERKLMINREIYNAAKSIEEICVNFNVPPVNVQADI